MLYIIFSLSSDTFEYIPIFGQQLELTSSQLSRWVNVQIIDDNVLEVLLKRFQANLVLIWPIMVTRADAIAIAPDLANVTIRDDDGETVRLSYKHMNTYATNESRLNVEGLTSALV